MRTTLLALAVCMAGALPGQWLKQPTAGIPRNADGKPNLRAPAPRTADGHPDLTGLWRGNPKYILNIANDLKPGEVQPWAEALYKQRSEDLAKDHMTVQCVPLGPGYATFGDMVKIIQTPTLIAILNPDMTYRQIYMDGRTLEKDPNPSWMGYSVGHWDGDTLVVESAGFNDRTWLDFQGHPHTEALRTSERYTRVDFGRMDLEYTIEDAKTFAKPFTVKIPLTFTADTEILEYVCNENEKDRDHMIGKASDDQKHAVDVKPEILAKYAGNYQMGPQVVKVSAGQGQLFFNLSGVDVPLYPFSEASFNNPLLGRVDFVTDAQGAVTHFMMQTVGGDFRANRAK